MTDILDLPDWTLLAKRHDGDEYELEAEYRLRHIRREGTRDELPAIPTLAEALGNAGLPAYTRSNLG